MDKVLILDFGSQYTQLIARRVREQNVYSEIHPFHYSLQDIKSFNPAAIILSGGPASVLDKDSPRIDLKILELGVPILGICYGLQTLGLQLGGQVVVSQHREYGRAEFSPIGHSDLFHHVSDKSVVWMSHGDSLHSMPPGFVVVGQSQNSPFCAIANEAKKIYGLQFHPEVVHTEKGSQILHNFLFRISGLKPEWNMASFLKVTEQKIRERVGEHKVICGLSGGVDSTVTAVLLHQAIGDQLECIFVNNALLRKSEAEEVQDSFREHFRIKLHYVDASGRFLKALSGVADPERKRKIIGHEFIQVFEQEAKKIQGVKFLAQGTLYPDVIESVSFKGPSATIKSHHNVGGLPEKMGLDLVEPLRELFKDEVRELGRELGIPQSLTHRHPFPGPGLGIRILGEITPERLAILREADAIFIHELKESHWYDKVWQAFVVLLPVKTVGVMGDERTYENVLAVRAVGSVDGMTADWSPLPHELLAKVSNRIINEVRGINRVVYDISSKPPATIEWE